MNVTEVNEYLKEAVGDLTEWFGFGKKKKVKKFSNKKSSANAFMKKKHDARRRKMDHSGKGFRR